MNLRHTSEKGRTVNFSRNQLLESLLKELNAELWLTEKRLLQQFNKPQSLPLILIMGPLRSGTTLFMQWLANTGLVAYPTNLLSRFYHAPILGAKIQLLLTDPRYNFRDELNQFSQSIEFKSENGKTKGALAPNGFWYFWRRFLSEAERDVWTDDELLKNMDVETMKTELTGVMDVFQKPFSAKGMLFNYNIPFLNSIFDKILFIQIKRDPISNVASILEARTRQLGTEHQWYSFKIPEYDQLKNLNPIMQSSGQLHYINKAIDLGMSEVDDSRKLLVQYEDFCARPHYFFNQLLKKLELPISPYNGVEKFTISRQYIKEAKAITKALNNFK
ncbi:sulfotransferase [Methylomarinum vadi]|uniref:sulfotransferase n=1 Tax=Methylomarinum vadi TaxID=438855 RepID=UPI000564B70D|nr:sulfotransferase [Methylomarinum vadi]